MSNISQLIDLINKKDFTPYDEIDILVKQIDNTWRTETAHCQLRKVKPNRRVYSNPCKKPSSNNPVVGYKSFKATTRPPYASPVSNTFDLNETLRIKKEIKELGMPNMAKVFEKVVQKIDENLNEKLRNLIRNTKVSYENKEKLREIGNALIESDYKKEEVIKKYKS